MTGRRETAEQRRAAVRAMAEADRWRKARWTSPRTVPGDRRMPTWGLLLATVAGWLVFNAGATIGRHTGGDFGDASVEGTATVERCERRGPLTVLQGIGFYDVCYLWVEWDREGWRQYPAERILVEEAGFFKGEQPGDRIRIGYGISRPELRESPAHVLAMIALCAAGGSIFLVGSLVLLKRYMAWAFR
ncbi:DUF6346 domain-containing protein [Actinoplanes utahensis]|nr:DUF6346 domain-containing protein [Actinoplanes utahensis]